MLERSNIPTHLPLSGTSVEDAFYAAAAAAVAETNAENHLANQLTRALTAHNPDTTQATHNLTRARDTRRNAVKALEDLEATP